MVKLEVSDTVMMMSSVAKKLISGSFIVTIGAFVGGVFSYLFNINMARMLGPSQYGDMVAILSFMMIASVGGGAILIVTMKYTGEYFAKGKLDVIGYIWRRISTVVFVFGLLIFLIALLLSPLVAELFSISSRAALMLGFAGFLLSLIYIVNRGVIQGMQKFTALSVVSAGEMVLRLIFGVLFVGLGWQIYGAIGAVIGATLIVYLLSFLPIRVIFKKQDDQKIRINRNEVARYSLPAIIANTLLVIGLNIDIIIVKFYFSPQEAGMYAAISTVAKIIIYATGPITAVMFPIVSEQKAKQVKHYKVFLFSMLATIGVGLACLMVYYFAPWTVIRVLYGEQYLAYYNLLPLVGLAILFYALINFMVHYFLAVSNFKFIWFFVLAIFGLLFASWQWHHSIELIAKQVVLFQGLVFLSLICYYLFLKRGQIINFFQGEYE